MAGLCKDGQESTRHKVSRIERGRERGGREGREREFICVMVGPAHATKCILHLRVVDSCVEVIEVKLCC